MWTGAGAGGVHTGAWKRNEVVGVVTGAQPFAAYFSSIELSFKYVLKVSLRR